MQRELCTFCEGGCCCAHQAVALLCVRHARQVLPPERRLWLGAAVSDPHIQGRVPVHLQGEPALECAIGVQTSATAGVRSCELRLRDVNKALWDFQWPNKMLSEHTAANAAQWGKQAQLLSFACTAPTNERTREVFRSLLFAVDSRCRACVRSLSLHERQLSCPVLGHRQTGQRASFGQARCWQCEHMCVLGHE